MKLKKLSKGFVIAIGLGVVLMGVTTYSAVTEPANITMAANGRHRAGTAGLGGVRRAARPGSTLRRDPYQSQERRLAGPDQDMGESRTFTSYRSRFNRAGRSAGTGTWGRALSRSSPEPRPSTMATIPLVCPTWFRLGQASSNLLVTSTSFGTRAASPW